MSTTPAENWQLIPKSLRYIMMGMGVTGGADPGLFFSSIIRLFPEATTLYVEGSSIDDAPRQLYEANLETGPYVPSTGSFHSKNLYRGRISAEFLQQLCHVELNCAGPELCDHLHLYAGEQPLLMWYDAFFEAELSGEIPEARVAEIAEALEMDYYTEAQWREVRNSKKLWKKREK